MKERGLNNVRGGDLRDTEDYIIRFGYIRDKFSWETAILILTLMLMIAYLLVDKYFF